MAKSVDLKKIIKATLLAQVITIVLVGIFGVFIYFGKISENSAKIIVFAIMIIALIFSAFVLAKNLEQAGLVNGLVLGIIFFLSLLVLSLMINGSPTINSCEVTRLVTILAAGMLGGVLGINA